MLSVFSLLITGVSALKFDLSFGWRGGAGLLPGFPGHLRSLLTGCTVMLVWQNLYKLLSELHGKQIPTYQCLIFHLRQSKTIIQGIIAMGTIPILALLSVTQCLFFELSPFVNTENS